MKITEKSDVAHENILLDMQEAQLDRLKVLEYYALTLERNQWRVNQKFKDKEIREGDLVLRYDSKLDFTFRTRFVTKWEWPFHMKKKFTNGSYQLEDLDGVMHKNRVNGLRLKKYNVRIMQVSLCGPTVMKDVKVENLMDEDVSYELQHKFSNELQDMNVFSMGVGKI